MEKYRVLGHFVNSFKNKEGEHISYALIFLIPLKEPEKGVITGDYVETQKVKPALLDNVEVGETVSLMYNKYGKVQEIVNCD